MTRFTTATNPTTIPRKMRTRHPARMPFGPRKILEVDGGCGTVGGDTNGPGERFIAGSDMQLITQKATAKFHALGSGFLLKGNQAAPTTLDKRPSYLPVKLQSELELPRIVSGSSLAS